MTKPDWGLDNVPEHVVREHACLRLQAEIASPFGLRAAMAPTTPYRAYYDALPESPLAPGSDPAIAIAAEAASRFATSAWRAPIEEALAATAALTTARHPLGFPLGPAGETCGGCAWLYVGGRGPAVARCRQTAPAVGDGVRTTRETPACARWEPPVDCQRLRRVLPRGLSFGDCLGPRSGRLEGTGPDHEARPPLRDPARRGTLRGAGGLGRRAGDAALRVHDLREPAAPLSRVRRQRAPLPRCAATRRLEPGRLKDA